jgi:hypothetical protein
MQFNNNQFGGGGWGANTLVQVTQEHLITLPQVAPEDPDVLKTIIITTNMSLPRPVFNGRETSNQPFRSTGIYLLGELAGKQPEHRKMIMPQLVTMLGDSAGRLDNPTNSRLLNDLADVESVGGALLKCGKEANEVLKKAVVPRLKELEFHKNASVRSAAKSLRKRIEAGPGAAQSGFPVTGTLALGIPSKTFSIPMKVGKTYIIDLRSTDFDAFLHLRNSFGQEVARDDDSGGGLNARITFECPQSGNYEIVATSLGMRGVGTFTLDVREQ